MKVVRQARLELSGGSTPDQLRPPRLLQPLPSAASADEPSQVGVRIRLMESCEKLAKQFEPIPEPPTPGASPRLSPSLFPYFSDSEFTDIGKSVIATEPPSKAAAPPPATAPDPQSPDPKSPTSPQTDRNPKLRVTLPQPGVEATCIPMPQAPLTPKAASEPPESPRPPHSPEASSGWVFSDLLSRFGGHRDWAETSLHGTQLTPCPHQQLGPQQQPPPPFESRTLDVSRPPVATPVSAQMLRKRSRFSNQPIIMNPWKPDPTWSFWRRTWQSVLFQVLRCVNHFITLQKMWRFSDFALCLLPLLAVYLCIHYKVDGDYNPGLYMSTIIFPISFAVHQAYNRRETALQQLAVLKACTFSYHACLAVWHSSMPGIHDTYLQVTPLLLSYGPLLQWTTPVQFDWATAIVVLTSPLTRARLCT